MTHIGFKVKPTIGGGGTTYVGYRSFDGSDDYIEMSIGGSSAHDFGPGSQFVLLDPDSVSFSLPLACANAAGQTDPANKWYLFFSGGGLYSEYGSGSFTGGMSVSTSDGWQIIGATKGNGSDVVRMHKYVFNTDTWTHSNQGSCNDLSPGTPGVSGTWHIGAGHYTGSTFDGDIACAGIWNTELDDTTIETLSDSLAAWTSSSPIHLWRCDDNPVNDLIGSADQVAITGSGISGLDSPLPVSQGVVSPE